MAKGSQFERDTCRQLSLWWTNNVRDDVFWRTSQSGGRATTRAKAGRALEAKGAYGDVTNIDPVGAPLIDRVSIELKRGYSRYSIQDLLDAKSGPNNLFEQFVAQARRDAEASGRTWMLVWRRDRREPVIVCDEGLLTALRDLGFVTPQVRQEPEIWVLPNAKIRMARFNDFLACWKRPDTEALLNGIKDILEREEGKSCADDQESTI